ncbi:hypothetical protein FOL47_005439 [Perkinsus chesapeaki]|uniref:Uncharacterized protein n=1 Tax=Perkinsus chesapeaki TaxID=330153 RepID=A0A7J6MYL0_PERCH|nr:hypothetical protein FOL47_005439 [Perkinsus chesapeaki]
MSYIPEDSGVSFFDVAAVSHLESRYGLPQDEEDDLEPAAEPSSSPSHNELYDSFEEAVWLESRTVPVLPERQPTDPFLHSGGVSTAPSSRPHSPDAYRSADFTPSLGASGRLDEQGEPKPVGTGRAEQRKYPVNSEPSNSWTPTPRRVEYRGSSQPVHPLSKSERAPTTQRLLTYLMSPQPSPSRQLPPMRVMHISPSPKITFSPRRVTSPMPQWTSPPPPPPPQSPYRLRSHYPLPVYHPITRSQPIYTNWSPLYHRQVAHHYPVQRTVMGYGSSSSNPPVMPAGVYGRDIRMTCGGGGASPVILQPLPSSMLFHA